MISRHKDLYTMKNIVRLIVICLTFLLIQFDVFATNYYVNDGSIVGDIYCTAVGSSSNTGLSPSSPKATLSSLISSLQSGDVVYVDAGTYTSTDRDINLSIAGVSIIGAGTNSTVFDNGATSDHYLFNVNANNITLSGFKTLRYAAQTSGIGQTLGVATGVIGIKINHVQVSQTSTSSEGMDFPVVIENGAEVDFVGGGVTCNNWFAGGGIIVKGGTVTFTNYIFSGNEGATVNGSGLKVLAGDVKVYNSLFSKNYTTNSQTGSAIYVEGGLVEVYDSKFDQNICDLSNDEVGGTIKVVDGTFKMYRSIISNHVQDGSSYSKGAGIGVYGYGSGRNPIVIVEQCHFFGNNGKTTQGTDIYLDYGTLTVTDCIFGSASKQVGLKHGTLNMSNCGNPIIYDAEVGGVLNQINTTASTYTANPTVPTFTGACLASSTSTGGGGTGLVLACATTLSYSTTNFCQLGSITPTFSPASGAFYAQSGLAINTSTGVVDLQASTAGSYIVTYMHNGCPASFNLTITAPNLDAITGSSSVCENSTITLTNALEGGSWSSSASQIASVNSSTGLVQGVSEGTATITYTQGGLGACSATTVTKTITVLDTPATPVISGGSSVEISQSIALTSNATNGQWTSSNDNIATVNASGIVTGVSLGTVTMTYTATSENGCSSSTTKVITVNNTGNPTCIGVLSTQSSVCLGSTPTFTSTVLGGIWTSSNESVATINPVTGVLNALTLGSTVIMYSKNGTGECVAAHASKLVTISSVQNVTIQGAESLVKGETATLSASQAGGTWSSSLSSVASVNSSGTVSGLNAGKSVISYVLSGSGDCISTTVKNVSVSDACTGAINEINVVCNGSTPTFSSTVEGGTWSSSNSAVGVIDGSNGLFTALNPGITNIVYTVPAAGNCPLSSSTKSITVTNTQVGVISGVSSVLLNESIQLSVNLQNGTWSTSNNSIATVNTSGNVAGSGLGIASIKYTYEGAGGCSAVITKDISVYSTTNEPCTGQVNDITSICNGSTPVFISTIAGGTWTTSNTLVGTINPETGLFTALTPGTMNVIYTIQGTGNCAGSVVTKPVIITNVNSATITGIAFVKKGFTTTLTSNLPNGTWTSTTPSIATITNEGLVTGMGAGRTTITYTYLSAGGCYATTTIDFLVTDPCTGVLNNISQICNGSTPTFTSTVTGGIWSSSNTSVATIDASTGLLTALTPGNTDITYTVNGSGGCANSVATKLIRVYTTQVGTLSGNWSVDVNDVTSFTSSISGGVWSTANSTIALVSPQNTSVGSVRGLKQGSTSISYTYESVSGCTGVIVKPIYVQNAGQVSCTGTINDEINTICKGSTPTFTSTVGGGVWTSSVPSVATINASSGKVLGVSAGYTLITYTINNDNCINKTMTKWLKVTDTQISSLTGSDHVNVGASVSISTPLTGGTWSSNNPGIASVNAGTVTGILAGNTIITFTYEAQDGCLGILNHEILVDNIDSTSCAGVLSNISKVCNGSTPTFTSSVPGGRWYSSNTNVATINPYSGLFTALVPGVTQISYILQDTICPDSLINTSIKSVAVTSTQIVSIQGASSVNTTENTQWSVIKNGGTWVSTWPTVATVSSTGLVSGLAVGTANISYQYTDEDGCQAIIFKQISVDKNVIENPDQDTCAKILSNISNICKGSTLFLQANMYGGQWTSSNLTKATIDPITGLLTALEAGNVVISYTMPDSLCSDSSLNVSHKMITISSTLAGSISGVNTIDKGSFTTWFGTPSNGTWYSMNSTIADINTSGKITGVDVGNTFISYTALGNDGCSSIQTKEIIVNGEGPHECAGEFAISGNKICKGSSVVFSSTVSLGNWTSSNKTVGTIDETTGLFNALTEGTTEIAYSVVCEGKVETIKKTIVVGSSTPITMATNLELLIGEASTLSPSVTGGSWSTLNGSIVSVNSSGVVTGVGVGKTYVTYSLQNSICTSSATTVVTVNNPVSTCAGVISDIQNICLGSTPTFTSSVVGGTWSVSNTTLATIDPISGFFRGLHAGTLVITYSKTCNSVIETTSKNVTIVDGLDVSFTTDKNLIYVNQTATIIPSELGGVWTQSTSTVTSYTTNTSTNSVTLTGLTPGMETMIYTLAGAQGCVGEYHTEVFVQSAPGTCTGTLPTITKVCTGSTPTFTSTVVGGVWASSNTEVGTVNAVTGVFTPVSTGLTTITYTVDSCGSTEAEMPIFVTDPNQVYITPLKKIKVNTTFALFSSVAGGVWTSSNPSIVSVSSTGVITGNSVGFATITYTLNGICSIVKTCNVNVYNTPECNTSLIGGPSICLSGSSSYSVSPVIPGTWSSSKPLIAPINSITGELKPLFAGSTVVKFTPTGACASMLPKTMIVTVVAPTNNGIISGPSNVLHGATETYTTSLTGGTWSTTNTDIANFLSPGELKAQNDGQVTVSYTVTGGVCPNVASKVVTVYGNCSGSLTGSTASICAGSNTTFISTVVGGLWTSDNVNVATVNPGTGVITGVSAGSTIIRYKKSGSCLAEATKTITVKSTQSAGVIIGASLVEESKSITFFPFLSGGSWTSSNNNIAMVNNSGRVTGISKGTAILTYVIKVPGKCDRISTKTIEVTEIDPTCSGVSPISYEITAATSTTKTVVFDQPTSSLSPISSISMIFEMPGSSQNFSVGQAISYTYDLATYTASQTVNLENGKTCSSSILLTLSNSCAGVSSIDYLISSSSSTGTLITFNSANSVSPISSISYSFGDGSQDIVNSSNVSVSHEYAFGSYTATRTVTLLDRTICVSSKTISIANSCGNLSSIAYTQIPAGTKTLVSFTDPTLANSSTSISTVAYDFGDGNMDNFLPGSDVDYIYQTGNYIVYRTVYLADQSECQSNITLNFSNPCTSVSSISSSLTDASTSTYTFVAPTTTGSSNISSVVYNFGDGEIVENNVANTTTLHGYTANGAYDVLQIVNLSNGYSCRSSQSIVVTTATGIFTPSGDNCSSFNPIQGHRYWVSAWVREEHVTPVKSYEAAKLTIRFMGSNVTYDFHTSGEIIDGWQRIVGDFIVPIGASKIELDLTNSTDISGAGFTQYFDDIRIHPFNASMKSYVYDPNTLLLSAELDDNNYSTFYEYDKEGQLIRIKKETERGIMTIQESRSSNPKKSYTKSLFE